MLKSVKFYALLTGR